MCCCFFCFKQKTADEIVISDWSSDVCSSDLAASVGQGLLIRHYTEELAAHGLFTGQVLLTVDDVTRRAHYRNAFQTFAKLLELGVIPIVKIGRASCRERVCQYV